MIPFLLSLIPRVAYFLFLSDAKVAPLPGSNYYWDLSENLKSTAFEPLYPVLLAISRWATWDYFPAVILIQIALASLGALYFHKLCLLLSAEKSVAWTGAALYSFYPYAVRQSSSVIEIPAFTTLLVLCAYFYCRAEKAGGFPAAGLAFGLVLLMRMAALPLFFLAALFLLLKRRFLRALLFIMPALILVTPYLIRNYALGGSVFPSRGGLNLFEGNCGHTDKVLPAYCIDLLNPYAHELLKRERPDLSLQDERAVDRFYTEKAIEFARANPLRFLKLKLLNLVYFFHPRIVPFYPMRSGARLEFTEEGKARAEGLRPRPKLHEAIHSATYGFIFFTAIFGLYFRRRELFKQDAVLQFITLGFVLVYSLYFPSTRLRAPMDFVLMFYSAVALNRWIPRPV